MILIFLISCAIFAIPVEDFNGRIRISLTALLACIAMQFTVSFNLPQVSYLTVIGCCSWSPTSVSPWES